MDSIMNKIKFNKEALNIIITEHVNKDQEDSIIELLRIDETSKIKGNFVLEET